LSLFLLFAACATVPRNEPLDRHLARAAALGFDGQVVIERDGVIIHDGVYGFADRGRAARVTRQTIFAIASESKQFTAAAILRLESDGKLQVTDTIDRWIDGVPADKRDITIHQLLTHTSGLPQGDVINDFETVTPAELIRKVLEQKRLPAGEWRYSNAGYNLLAAIIEKASGSSYPDYLRRAIFEPAGLKHTGVVGVDSARYGDAATAYRGFAPQGSVAAWPRNWRTWGGGDLFSTAEDLARFARLLREGRIIPAAQWTKMTAPHVKLKQSEDVYGYAWFVGKTLLEHGGDTELGFSCTMRWYPEEKIALILTSNRTEVNGIWLRWGIQDALASLAMGRAADPLPDVHDAAQRLADGVYVSEGGGRVAVSHVGPQLLAEALDPRSAVALWNVGADAASLAKAVTKTTSMLEGAQAGRVREAFADALAADGAEYVGDYIGEWDMLTKEHGALRSFDIRGAIPMRRGAARVFVELTWERGRSGITYLWRDKGEGRLIGSSPGEGPPLARVFAAAADGSLVAYEFGSKTTLAMTASGEALTVGGVVFRRKR
jgi:CubicO group peptidase (beta-lactamase class C family)